MLLDWDLPDVPGTVLLDELRQTGVTLPVVFLTGYAFSTPEILALEKGAVDFVDKTRGVEILASRLRRLLSISRTAVLRSP
jgi:two-component system response regulator ChvI